MRSPAGASAGILRSIRDDQATLLLSVPLAMEYEAVCQKASHRVAAGLTQRQVNVFLDALIAMAEPVETHFLWPAATPRSERRDGAGGGGQRTSGRVGDVQ